MVIPFFFIVLLFQGRVVSAIHHKGAVRHPKESESKGSTDTELIVENFVELDHGLNETWMANDPQTPDGDDHSTNETASKFAELLMLHSSSAESHLALERDKGGTMKVKKEGSEKDTKGKTQKMKGAKQEKPQKMKGEKTKDKT